MTALRDLLAPADREALAALKHELHEIAMRDASSTTTERTT